MSNIKANMRIRMLDKLKRWHIFPHMGDGGIALGAAMQANYELNGNSAYEFGDSYLGDDYSDDYIKGALKKEGGLSFELERGKAGHAAEIIESNDYVLWFQGRMEYGPRALGNRSILGNASSDRVKDKLNTYVKQREWYQPFAPSMLEEEAGRLLSEVKGKDRFMTMGYMAKDSARDVMKSVVHVDMTARPQMVGEENVSYRDLLRSVKKRTGYGVVLNTSFNIHGMPIVASPEDAVGTLKKTNSRYMFLGNYFVENRMAEGCEEMRIAFVYDVPYPWHVGGIESMNYNEAEELAKEHEVHFFTTRWEGMTGREFVYNNIHYHAIHKTDQSRIYRHGRRSIRKRSPTHHP